MTSIDDKKASDAMYKAIDVIHSCTRRIHVVNARVYCVNFMKAFPKATVRSQYLAYVFNHHARMFNVKLLRTDQ